MTLILSFTEVKSLKIIGQILYFRTDFEVTEIRF